MGSTQSVALELEKAQLPPGVEPQNAQGPYPLSQAQESLWFMAQMSPGSALYHMPEAWELKGKLDVRVLQQSLDELVRRHEILRTVFKSTDGKPQQVVLGKARLNLKIVDLVLDSSETKLKRTLENEARLPFDFGCAPLARATLFRLSTGRQILLLNVHHIIFDAWSQGVFMRELAARYTSLAQGKGCELPPLPIQYADFALWQGEMLGSEAGRSHLVYWKEKFPSPPKALLLPSDHPRSDTRSYRGVTHFFKIPAGLVDQIKGLSRREGVTPYMCLLAAFKVLLYRCTQETEIVVGSPMACRERVEIEDLVGYFVHTLPLRSDLRGDPTFLELLRRVRETVLDAYSHQELPCELLIKNLTMARACFGHPLFQLVFGWQTASPSHWSLPGLEATRIEVDTGTAKFDWTVLVTEDEGGLRLRSESSLDLFEPATMLRLVHQFQVLLQSIVEGPETKISELRLLTDQERDQLVKEWNQSSCDYERESPIHKVFEEQSAKTPTETALIFDGARMSYQELNRRANQLARVLQSRGVEVGARVGICLPRSIELVVAMLAVLKAGGAYVPLDPEYPPERHRFMLNDAGAIAVLTNPEQSTKLQAVTPAGAVVVFDNEDGSLAGEDPDDLPTSFNSSCPAYVMYTSGSTGSPKGVIVPHRAVVRLVRHTNYLCFSTDHVFLQAAPVTFDASTFEIWGALLNGARLVLLPPEVPSLEQLARAIRENHVTTLWLTSGLFDQMVDQHLDDLRGLKYLLTGGDVLSPVHVSKAVRQLTGCQLINGYGPTENTTFSCCYQIPRSWPDYQPVPIGRPIANTRIYVLDQKMAPVPIGIPGELYVGGDGLAGGYLNQPNLTAEKFLHDPFGTAGSLVYRTGDAVRWRADGNLEFLGRIDDQVKIRGFRVEPGEVERALIQHPSVARVAVVVREHQFIGKHLVAYVVLRSECAPGRTQLREFLESKLPSHMVPSRIMLASSLPLTANGKVDRRVLPEPIADESEPVEPQVAPRTATEGLVARIWTEVLGRDVLSVHNNFFNLGGHSLLATQMISRLSRSCGVELPIRVIFEAPTVARLAAAIEIAQRDAVSTVPAITRTDPRQAEQLLQHLDEFTEEQIEQMLQDPQLKSA